MRSFKDRAGQSWMCDITLGTVERVQAECGVDLPGLVGDRMAGLDALLADSAKLVAVIYECCRGQELGSPPRTLADLKATWDGATADAAIETFLEDLIGFFPDANRRALLRRAIESLKEFGQRMTEKAGEAMTPEAIRAMADGVYSHLRTLADPSETASASAAGSTAATSASTPDRTRFASSN